MHFYKNNTLLQKFKQLKVDRRKYIFTSKIPPLLTKYNEHHAVHTNTDTHKYFQYIISVEYLIHWET